MCAQAMSLMLPPAVQREDAPDDPVAAKLECMTLNGMPEACCSTRPPEQCWAARPLSCTQGPRQAETCLAACTHLLC